MTKKYNDQFSKKLSVDNNERLAFIKHLFDGDKLIMSVFLIKH